eukprot:3458320-Rhodomonas_salina.1
MERQLDNVRVKEGARGRCGVAVSTREVEWRNRALRPFPWSPAVCLAPGNRLRVTCLWALECAAHTQPHRDSGASLH